MFNTDTSMTPSEYVKQAVLTECPYDHNFYDRITPFGRMSPPNDVNRLMHAGMGMVTEAGEFIDVIKKYMMYGKPMDKTNLAEEVGDMLWYIAIACDTLGVDLADVMASNIQKLRTRYPNKFTSYDAIHRNLVKEREVLDQIGVTVHPDYNGFKKVIEVDPLSR